MLLYPPMNELLNRVSSRYMLVNVVANRARKISSEAEHSGESLFDKPVSMAVKEVADGTLVIDLQNEGTEEA